MSYMFFKCFLSIVCFLNASCRFRICFAYVSVGVWYASCTFRRCVLCVSCMFLACALYVYYRFLKWLCTFLVSLVYALQDSWFLYASCTRLVSFLYVSCMNSVCFVSCRFLDCFV